MCEVPLCLLDKLFLVKWAKEKFFIKSKTIFSSCSYGEQQHTISISANTLTEDPDIRTRIFRSILSGYLIITKLRIVYRPVLTVYIITEVMENTRRKYECTCK